MGKIFRSLSLETEAELKEDLTRFEAAAFARGRAAGRREAQGASRPSPDEAPHSDALPLNAGGKTAVGPFSELRAKEEVAKAAELEWNRDPGIRAEFCSLKDFIAWRVAESQGRARVFAGGGVKHFSPEDFRSEGARGSK